MIRQGHGRIVNVSSRGASASPAYGASKAGLNALGQSLAVALAPHNVQVMAVAPGFVETDMAAQVCEGESGAEKHDNAREGGADGAESSEASRRSPQHRARPTCGVPAGRGLG